MITREELLKSPEYWFEHAQNDLYGQVVEYMSKEGINQNQLAEHLGVTKSYVSQILKGEFNYTLKKLIDISLAIGLIPKIEYQSIEEVISNDVRTQFVKLDGISSYVDTEPGLALKQVDSFPKDPVRITSEPEFGLIGQIA